MSRGVIQANTNRLSHQTHPTLKKKTHQTITQYDFAHAPRKLEQGQNDTIPTHEGIIRKGCGHRHLPVQSGPFCGRLPTNKQWDHDSDYPASSPSPSPSSQIGQATPSPPKRTIKQGCRHRLTESPLPLPCQQNTTLWKAPPISFRGKHQTNKNNGTITQITRSFLSLPLPFVSSQKCSTLYTAAENKNY